MHFLKSKYTIYIFNRFLLLSEIKTNLDIEQRNSQENPDTKTLIHQNNSSLNEIFYSLQNDFKNIQIELEEKTKTNKKLYEDFKYLLLYLEKEVTTVEKLKNEKETYSISNQELNEEMKNFEQNMTSLDYSKNEYLKELNFLTQQNNILSKQIEDEQNEINKLEQEKIKYNSLNKEMKLKNSEKLNVIKLNDDEINYYQKQLDNANISLNKMINMINELENYYENLKNQYVEYKEKHKLIENKKFNNDKVYQELIDDINKKESYIKDNLDELDSISGKKEELYNCNTQIYNDLDKIQNHIYELSEQNEKLMESISKFKKIEEMINNHIISKKEINQKLNDEKIFIENIFRNNLKEDSENEKNNKNFEDDNLKKRSDNLSNSTNINENQIKNNLYSNNQNLDNKDLNSNNDINNFNSNKELNLENNYNNLFNNLIQKSEKNNYLGFQKELELEHDYE